MKRDEKDVRRRRWAEQNIAALNQQRAGIDRKIEEFRAFLRMLDASDGAIANGDHAGGPQESLPDAIEAVLREAGGRALTAEQVADAVAKRGWKAGGDTPLRHRVGLELPRQVKLGKRDIVRVEVGKYASGGVS